MFIRALTIWLSMLVCFVTLSTLAEGAAEIKKVKSQTAVIRVKVSSDATYYTDIPLLKDSGLQAAIRRGIRTPLEYPDHSDTQLLVYEGKQAAYFRVADNGDLIDEERNETITLPHKWKSRIVSLKTAARLRHYGNLRQWAEVKGLMPKPTTLTVLDLETGLKFQAQRRAGRDHADVQPLTKMDTRTMKEIYGGSWSWDRRAIVVEVGEHRLAASMHGMPHGGDGIAGNGFAGHFCIHFLNSTTHGKGNLDSAHQLMVHKAAGLLPRFVDAASPQQLIDYYVIAMDQHDPYLLSLIMANSPDSTKISETMKQITGFRRAQIEIKQASVDGDVALQISIPIDVQRLGERGRKEVQVFTFLRHTPYDPWKIEKIEIKVV